MTKYMSEYGLVVSFVDQSEAFVLGFEAGMLWKRMQDGEPYIEMQIHTKNKEVIKRMASAEYYSAIYESVPMYDEWSVVKLTKISVTPIKPSLKIVK